jgi:replication factor A1
MIEKTLKSGRDTLEEAVDYYPISSLTPSNSDWIILAKVTNKASVRKYTNKNGEGKLLNFELTDSDGVQIQCTCFNDMVDKFDPILIVGKIFKISKADVKISNKRYTSIAHDYCLVFNSGSVVEEAKDQSKKISDIAFNFKKIAKLKNTEVQLTVDLIGIVFQDFGTTEIQTKNGSKTIRNFTLIDDSKDDQLEDDDVYAIDVSIWGENSGKIDLQENKAIAIKNARTNTYRGGVKIS